MNESKWEVRKGTIWLGSFPNYDAAEFYRTKRYGNGRSGKDGKLRAGFRSIGSGTDRERYEKSAIRRKELMISSNKWKEFYRKTDTQIVSIGTIVVFHIWFWSTIL